MMILVTWSYERLAHKVGMTRETSGRSELDFMHGRGLKTGEKLGMLIRQEHGR